MMSYHVAKVYEVVFAVDDVVHVAKVYKVVFAVDDVVSRC